MDEIEEEIRKIPLAERLERSSKIVQSLASQGRYPRMSVPAQATDEDIFVLTTLSDALELINSLGCRAGSDGDCNWSECPQAKSYKTICPLYKNCEDE